MVLCLAHIDKTDKPTELTNLGILATVAFLELFKVDT